MLRTIFTITVLASMAYSMYVVRGYGHLDIMLHRMRKNKVSTLVFRNSKKLRRLCSRIAFPSIAVYFLVLFSPVFLGAEFGMPDEEWQIHAGTVVPFIPSIMYLLFLWSVVESTGFVFSKDTREMMAINPLKLRANFIFNLDDISYVTSEAIVLRCGKKLSLGLIANTYDLENFLTSQGVSVRRSMSTQNNRKRVVYFRLLLIPLIGIVTSLGFFLIFNTF